MAIANSTVTVNAAFFQEIKEVNQELWSLLDDVRGCFADGQAPDARRVVELMADLRDQMALHFALEEAYGYFDDPVAGAPHLGERAEELRLEHRTLYVKMSDLAEYVEQLQRRDRLGALMDQVSRRFKNFDELFHRHEVQENELITEAYDEDIGVGD